MKKIWSASWRIIIFSLIFVSCFLILIISAKLNSQTTDEGVHLAAGYTYLTQKDFRYDPEHPPFLKELAAVPLLFIKDISAPLGEQWRDASNFYYDSWWEARTFGENFLYGFGNNAEKLLFWGRFPFIILTLILGLVVYFWAGKLYGKKAGLLAAFLTLFFPNILAHGILINTDLGLTLFILLSVYFWGRFLKSPNVLNFIFVGIFIGLSFASKYTAVLIIPILIILLIVKLILDQNTKNFWKYLIGLFLLIPTTFLVCWASYGFSLTAPTAISGSLSTEIGKIYPYNIPTNYDHLFATFRPYLIPAHYIKGLILVTRHALGGHGAYLLGAVSGTGWWYYFPVAILFKTPIPIFVLLIVTIIYFKKIKSKDIFNEYLLILPPILFLILAMYSKANLGIRHILPIFPFIFIFIAKTVNLIDFKKFKLATIGFIILILWYLFSVISSFSNYLAYFNEFVEGPKNGYKILSDSNLDWGQNIKRIKKYVEPEKRVNTYFRPRYYIVYPWDGQIALNYYGLENLELPEDKSKINGEVIITDSYLRDEYYAWLNDYPSKQIAPGVFVFDVSAR